MQKLSVLVRFRNEALYLESVLRAVRSQHYSSPIEIVAVDNASTDASRAIAEEYADTVIDITDYRPGAALNRSIEASTGDHIVALSAHAIPANDQWLDSLTAYLRNAEVLGVYGAQHYPCTSKFLDKRDLDIFSDITPRTEKQDSDFWNANSSFARSSWEKHGFEETVVELEDHFWTKEILGKSGQWVRFEPTAAVYHYGHDARNDRQILAPTPATSSERIEDAILVLDRDDVSWPEAMSAGMTLGCLWSAPDIGRAVPSLGRYLTEYWDFDVRWRMAGALGRIDHDESVMPLICGLSDASFYVRDECAWSLARLGARAAARLISAAERLDPRARPFAGLALGMSGTADGRRAGLALLSEAATSGDLHARQDAIYFLGEIATIGERPELADTVVNSLGSEDYHTARGAVWTWGRLAESGERRIKASTPSVLEAARQHPHAAVRAEAVVALGRLARAIQSAELILQLGLSLEHDGSGHVRYAAMQNLRLAAEQGSDAAAEAARQHTTDIDFGVVFERSLTLAALDGLPTTPQGEE